MAVIITAGAQLPPWFAMIGHAKRVLSVVVLTAVVGRQLPHPRTLFHRERRINIDKMIDADSVDCRWPKSWVVRVVVDFCRANGRHARRVLAAKLSIAAHVRTTVNSDNSSTIAGTGLRLRSCPTSTLHNDAVHLHSLVLAKPSQSTITWYNYKYRSKVYNVHFYLWSHYTVGTP